MFYYMTMEDNLKRRRGVPYGNLPLKASVEKVFKQRDEKKK